MSSDVLSVVTEPSILEELREGVAPRVREGEPGIGWSQFLILKTDTRSLAEEDEGHLPKQIILCFLKNTFLIMSSKNSDPYS